MATFVKKGKGFLITVFDGYDEHGKQVRHRFQWNPDTSRISEEEIQEELERIMQEYENKYKGRKIIRSGKTKFSVVLNDYYDFIIEEAARGNMSEMTVDRYIQEKSRLLEKFGHKPIDKITPYLVKDFIESLSQSGANKNTGKALSAKAQRQTLSILSNVFNYALDNNYDISDNPCNGLKIKSTNKKSQKTTTYTIEEMNVFIDALKKAPLKYQLYFSLLLNTGLRTEEILGLKWESVDLFKKTICVENAVSHSRRKGNYEHDLKTKGSYRYLAISKDLINLFVIYKSKQQADIDAFGDKWISNNYVFTGEYGGPMGSNTARHWLIKFCKREGLRYIPPHSFRHFTATALISCGVPINIVSNYIGHSNVSTTSDIYCDAVQKYDAESEIKQNLANVVGLNFDFGYGSND